MTPPHVAPVGTVLPHDYFAPGPKPLWAVAFFQGQSFRYERAGLGQPWVRVE